MDQGEVWMVSLPLADGREQGGQRPAIVLQDSIVGQGSPLVIVAPLTSQLAALRFPGTWRLQPSEANGLSAVSVAMVFQLRALDRDRLVKRLGRIEAQDLEAILGAQDGLLGRT